MTFLMRRLTTLLMISVAGDLGYVSIDRRRLRFSTRALRDVTSLFTFQETPERGEEPRNRLRWIGTE
jgi:hypothetical protein